MAQDDALSDEAFESQIDADSAEPVAAAASAKAAETPASTGSPLIDRLKLNIGEGITGWVAEHQEPVAVTEKAALDPRFQLFHELPEDSYEAFLSVPLMCRGRVMGVINLQHRLPRVYNRRQIRLISTIGFLVGAEIELARLEEANLNLSEQLQTRKIVERAKGILQRELGLNEEQAYLALQRQSRQKRKAMKEIAEAILLSDEVKGNSRLDPS